MDVGKFQRLQKRVAETAAAAERAAGRAETLRRQLFAEFGVKSRTDAETTISELEAEIDRDVREYERRIDELRRDHPELASND